jgi:branched-chain amino acid transport system substrate-binding protein
MKSKLILRLLAIVITVILLSPSVGAAATKEPLVIGALYPLTGGGATQGIPAKISAEIAVEEINERGGILGRPVKFIVLDDKANPQEGLRLAKVLVDEHKADYLIGGSSWEWHY